MTVAIGSLGAAGLELSVRGMLDEDDYREFVPLAEQRIERHGKIGLLVHIGHLEGWTPKAFWQDLKFDAKHYNDIARLALVGEESKKWLAMISKPFTRAEVEFFPESRIDAAREWVTERLGA